LARNFKNWLRAYCDYTGDSESPTTFHFWTGVSAVAGALRRRVWIDMRKFQWTPNFYIILVGPPGVVTKSTSISIGTRLLSKVPDVLFGPESMTWQALADSLAGASIYVRYKSSTGEDLQEPMSPLTISVGELGTFLTMDDDKLLSFLIRMWDGQQDSFMHKTRTQPLIEVKNPWLNVIGATTPSWLRQNFPTYMIGGGLTSRIIFVYGDKKRRLIPYPDEIFQQTAYTAIEKGLIEDLITISQLAGPYTLTSEARAWGHQWYTAHSQNQAAHLASERYEGYLARKQTHIHKLAMVMAACQSDVLVLEKSYFVEAETIITAIEADMIKVFESIGVVDEARHAAEILAFVRAAGFLSQDELWRHCMRIMDLKSFEGALKAMVRGGALKIANRNGILGVILPPDANKMGPNSGTA
jgi:hypothetical protein